MKSKPDFGSAQKCLKSPLQRTDSQQENGLIMNSIGQNTPTPHKFNGMATALISEFDPMSGQKPTLVDNFLQTQNLLRCETHNVDLQ